MIIDDAILRNKTAFWTSGKSGEVGHRSAIIMGAADLELLLAGAVIAWLGKVNPQFNAERAKKELIDEGPLGSLTKLAEVAFHAGIIGEKTKHDLRRFAKLRDRYAHDRHRGQLDDDPDMFKLIQDTYLYRENRAKLEAVSDLHEQRALIAVCEQLKVIVQSGVVE